MTPAGRCRGRPPKLPAEARREGASIRLSAAEWAEIDRRRGDLSRAEFLVRLALTAPPPEVDAPGSPMISHQSLRGGSWAAISVSARAARRFGSCPTVGYGDLGVRLVVGGPP